MDLVAWQTEGEGELPRPGFRGHDQGFCQRCMYQEIGHSDISITSRNEERAAEEVLWECQAKGSAYMVGNNLCVEIGCLVFFQSTVPIWTAREGVRNFHMWRGSREGSQLAFQWLQVLDYSHLTFKSGRMHGSIARLWPGGRDL